MILKGNQLTLEYNRQLAKLGKKYMAMLDYQGKKVNNNAT